jgi:signal transduction histidine kinase/HPt (histidine-containing phosphotransfer) domain-containing protein
MDMMSLPGFRALAQDRARRFSCSGRAASIRYATVFGSILAFALLCILSVRANAAPVVDGGTRTQVVSDLRPVAPVAAREPVVARARSGDAPSFPESTFAAEALDAFDAAFANESGLLQDGIAVGARHAATTCHALLALLLTLAVVSFGGWCRTRAALKRAAEKLRGVESEWQRRYIAVEAREQVVRATAATQTAAAAQERERILTTMRHFVSGPLSALAGLLEALDGASVVPAQRPLAGKIQSAVRTCVRVLEDMLAPSPVEARAVVLDESLTDLRELIDGVVALFSPAAVQKGLYLSVSVEQSVAARVVTDSDRLGQIVFHMLSDAVRSTEHGQITVAARAEPLNAGSQRIFICVRDVGATAASSASAIQAQLPWLFAAGTPASASDEIGASGFALCQRLTQHMRGDLTVGSEPGFGTSRTFSAPFAIEHSYTLAEQTASEDQKPHRATAGEPAQTSATFLVETFDPSYLDALSNEGIDLHTFVRGWRQSMVGDLERMRTLRDQNDVNGLRASLHRLSGAVGLVGARGLMEALRRASAAQPGPEARAIEALAERIESLITQLDKAIEPHRNNLQ